MPRSREYWYPARPPGMPPTIQMLAHSQDAMALPSVISSAVAPTKLKNRHQMRPWEEGEDQEERRWRGREGATLASRLAAILLRLHAAASRVASKQPPTNPAASCQPPTAHACFHLLPLHTR